MEERELLNCLTEDVSLGMELVIRQYGSAVKTICRSILSGYSKEDIEETVSDIWNRKTHGTQPPAQPGKETACTGY